MKVKTTNFIYPYTVDWFYDYMDKKYGTAEWFNNKDQYTTFEKLLEKLDNFVQFLLDNTVNLIQMKRKRKVYVKVDSWDAWSGSNTLAIITLPLLKRIKQDKLGAPYVSNEDVPEHLKSLEESEYVVDKNWFDRWDYVLDEMIWTFERLSMEDWTDLCYEGVFDAELTPEGFVYGSNHTSKFNKEKYEELKKRIDNGLMLFAKYFQNLSS
jgi:hypothetical protein